MDGDRLRATADRIKAEMDIREAAAIFGYDYERRGPYPCPMCHDVSRSRLVLKLYHEDDITRRKVRWHCFHCKTGGDIIDWVAARLGVRKGAAISALADRLGFGNDPGSLLDWLRSELSVGRRAALATESLADDAARAVYAAFRSWAARCSPTIEGLLSWDRALGMARSASPVMRERIVAIAPTLLVPSPVRVTDTHLSLAHDAQRYRGEILSGAEPYASYAADRGWLTEELDPYKVGACPFAGERMEGRVVFPIRDSSGRHIGFGGRVVDASIGPKPGAKYLNSSESPTFSKGRTLYGLDLAAGAILRDGYAVMAEGYADVLALRAAGLDGSVAPCGTSLTHAQAESLSLFTDRVVLLNDGDAAGDEATARSRRVLAGARIRSFVGRLPRGLDPDDLLREAGPVALRRVVAAALAPPLPDRRLDDAADALRAG